MDTIVTISVVSNSKDNAEKAIDNAFSEIEGLEKLSNFFSPDSEVSIINRNAGISPVKVSPELLEIIEKTLYVSEKTEGIFDITIGAVIKLYDFHKKIKPEDDEIKKSLPLVNYKNLIIDKNKSTVFLRKTGMLIDLGGIVKGYAADKAVEILKRQGINSALVSVAGDIKAFGVKPDGRPWNIGIRNPRAEGEEDDIMATIKLSNMAISTSGDYERYFILDGKRYHHLLDPKTGYPAEGFQSVSVITDSGVFADAFSTAIFILGPERGTKILKEMSLDGITIDSRGEIYTTPDIRGMIEFKRNP
jgi:thiamine biosynthesis lipoprotein